MSSYSFSENGLLLEALLVEQLRSQPVDFLGELGAFMDRPRLLLSSALGRVESFPMSLSMLLDVLVLGHLLWGRGGGVASRRALRCRVAAACSHGDSRRALVRFAAEARVCNGCGDFLSAFYV